MQTLRLGDQLVEFDREATAAAYRAIPKGGADCCGCIYCRNFAAQRASIYPETFLSLLVKLGIDPNKEGAVFDKVGPFEDRIRPTGGWFYFVGEFVDKGERLMVVGDFQYWLQPTFPRPPACFGNNVIAIEFSASIPWVLQEDAY